MGTARSCAIDIWEGGWILKRILAVNPGSYPRIGDSPEQQRLSRALDAFARGEIPEAELAAVREETVREVLAEQARAGLDLVSDGHVRWHDPVSHLMGRLGAVESAGLRRYFDTGTLYLKPRVSRRLAGGNPLVAEEMKWAGAVSMRPVVVSILGPLTLSRLSGWRGGPYAGPDELGRAIIPFLAEEVERLAGTGVAAVVLEEPSLIGEPEALPLVADCLEVLAARKGGLRLWLYPSLGDAGPLFPGLQALAADGLLLDVFRGPAAADAIRASGTPMCLGLGLTRPDSTRMEAAEDLAEFAGKLLRKTRGDEAWLFPAGGLEGLPRADAREKLLLLAKVRDMLLGGRTGGARPKPVPLRRHAVRKPRVRKARPGKAAKRRLRTARRPKAAKRRRRR